MIQAKYEEFEGAVKARCEAELSERGLRWTAKGASEIDLSSRFTGWVGLPAERLKGAPGLAVLVAPLVGIRDVEVSGLVAELQSLPEGDPAVKPRYVVIKELGSLLPERGQLPHEWVASSVEGNVDQVARRVAEDVVFAGFPYLEGLASPVAYFEEFKRAPRRVVWPRESAVTYMMHGELEEAKRMLWHLARPVSQKPTVWGDNAEAAVSFFAAFESHFGVDLGIGDWPVRGPRPEPRVGIKIRDRGVVPAALALVDRSDLAERGAGLSEADIERVGERASEIMTASTVKDPDRAIGLAAVEFLSSKE